jgi:hypothetical protein
VIVKIEVRVLEGSMDFVRREDLSLNLERGKERGCGLGRISGNRRSLVANRYRELSVPSYCCLDGPRSRGWVFPVEEWNSWTKDPGMHFNGICGMDEF